MPTSRKKLISGEKQRQLKRKRKATSSSSEHEEPRSSAITGNSFSMNTNTDAVSEQSDTQYNTDYISSFWETAFGMQTPYSLGTQYAGSPPRQRTWPAAEPPGRPSCTLHFHHHHEQLN